MKKMILAGLLCLFLSFCGCGQKAQEPSIYFSPHGRQTVCFLDGKLHFVINGGLYRGEEEDGKLALKRVEGEAGTVAYDSLIYGGEDGAAYLVSGKEVNDQEVVSLSKDYQTAAVCSLKDDPSAVYTFSLVSDGICYCIKATPEGQAGQGQTLKMFPLKDSGERTLLHVWNNTNFQDVIPLEPPKLQKCGRYLVITYRDEPAKALWVYDTKNQKMAVEGDGDMAYAAYCSEKLYFIDEGSGCVGAYDLEKGRRTEDSILIRNYREGMTLACDEDYLYIIQSACDAYGDDSQENSRTQVYNYEGELVDTIDLGGNDDARKLEICGSSQYGSFMCSTDRYIFFGSRTIDTRGLFYVDKSQVGTGEVTVHTLYAE